MSRRIPDEVIEAVLRANDIVDVVGRYVHLTKQGQYMKGLCPFHSEKSPSFTVRPEKQIYHCFGCHAGGNVIHFVMGVENLTFPEAVRQMAEDSGIPVEWEPVSEQETEQQALARSLYEAHEFAAKFYHHILRNTAQGKTALEYLRNRGMNDRIIDTFMIGYSPPMWDTLAQFLDKRGYDLPLMERGGLISRREDGGYYDKFRDRIMFPIHDQKGRVIAFGGRAMGDVQPKYMNSPESLLFNKSRNLYNFHQSRAAIRKTRTVVLLEGYVDVIKAWEAGVTNGVASMGTALTPEQTSLLRRNAEEAIVCYDGDNAGQNAAFKSIPLLEKEGFHVKVAWLPSGLDPDEYVGQHGPEKFRHEIIEGALTSVKFKLLYIRRNFNLQDVDGRFRYIEAALRLVAEVESPVEREHYVKELAAEFPYASENFMQQMHGYRQDLLKKRQPGDNTDISWNNVINNGNAKGKTPVIEPAEISAEVKLLSAMMHDREAALEVQEAIGEQFSQEVHAALAAYLYAFYANGFGPDVSRFISTLQDERLERTAAKISLQDPKPALVALESYIRAVKIYPELTALKRSEKELEQQAAHSPDPLAAARELLNIKKEIQALEKQLKSL